MILLRTRLPYFDRSLTYFNASLRIGISIDNNFPYSLMNSLTMGLITTNIYSELIIFIKFTNSVTALLLLFSYFEADLIIPLSMLM